MGDIYLRRLYEDTEDWEGCSPPPPIFRTNCKTVFVMGITRVSMVRMYRPRTIEY